MKRTCKRVLSMLLVLIMLLCVLPMTALAALESGEQRTCKFQILYVDDSFYVGYNYGESWNVD